jgi:hypothetical protein
LKSRFRISRCRDEVPADVMGSGHWTCLIVPGEEGRRRARWFPGRPPGWL